MAMTMTFMFMLMLMLRRSTATSAWMTRMTVTSMMVVTMMPTSNHDKRDESGKDQDGEEVLLIEEILHDLLSMKPYENWDTLHINWCRISSINSITMKARSIER